MEKQSFKNLIFAIVALAVSLVVVTVTVFAWFSMTKQNELKETNFKIVDDQSSSVLVSAVNGDKSDLSGNLYPGDSLLLDLSVSRDVQNFGFRVEVTKLTPTEFSDFFLTQNHLTIGEYFHQAAGLSLISEINLDEAFDDYERNYRTTLTPAQRREGRINFLKKFTDNNALLSAISVRLIKVNDTETDIELIKNNEDGFYPETAVAYAEGTTLRVKISFGGETLYNSVTEKYYAYQPKMSYLTTDRIITGINHRILPLGTYYANNLNCFLGQSMSFAMLSEE